MDRKRILLIDLDDPRRSTRVQVLEQAGFDVEVRKDHEIAELQASEDAFDLVLITLHRKKLKEAAQYSDRLAERWPTLPILLLADHNVFAPRETISRCIETDGPQKLLSEITQILAGSTHVRDVESSLSVD
jgi:DNA-binding NtrC family response regulator